MVWFRVGCCERCGGVGSRGERGSGTEAAGLDSIPSIASIIPKMRMMRGNGGTIPLKGGGGGYVAQGLVHICGCTFLAHAVFGDLWRRPPTAGIFPLPCFLAISVLQGFPCYSLVSP